MTKPNITIGSSVGFKKEGTAGTQESLATGASFLDIMSAGLKYTPIKYSEKPVIGTRIKAATDEQVSHHDGKGTTSVRARAAYIEALVEMILGRVNGAGFSPIEDNTELPSYTFEGNVANANTIALVGVKANEMVFKSEAGQPLIIDLDLVARSGVRNAVITTPDYSAWASDLMFMHSNLSLAATNATWLSTNNILNEVKQIELVLKNNLADDDFTNSATRQFIAEGVFEGTLKLTVPYNTTTKGYWQAVADLDVVVFDIDWTDATNTLNALMSCHCETELPEINDVQGQFIDLEFSIVKTATDTDGITMTVS